MGVETLRKIRKAEEDRLSRVKAAQAEADKIKARAAKTAAHIIEGAKKEAEESAAALKRQKIGEGKKEADKILSESEKDLQSLKSSSEKNMDKAVELVLRRVCG
jgi:vacuolar-type H+-ATPase subunit H